MNILFLMDPLETVHPDKDTTFLLMRAASQRGHKIYYLPEGGISRVNGRTQFRVTEVIPDQKESPPFVVAQTVILHEDETDIVFIRTNPPFDEEYLYHTWLLDLLPDRVAVLNQPSGIRAANEKIWATQFTDIVPPTLVSRSLSDMTIFLAEHKEIIAKPIDGFGGQSVFYLKEGSVNTGVILETLTQNQAKDIILQKYVPAAQSGDKRILLLNGEPLGAVLRVHAPGEHRNNFFSGGRAEKTEITANDHIIIEKIKSALKALGLYFVGIDILGDYLIEINVTSPTCLQEMVRFNGIPLENQVIDFAETLAAKDDTR